MNFSKNKLFQFSLGFFLLSFVALGPLSAQQYTRIGVVDISRVWAAVKKTPTQKDIDTFRADVQAENLKMTEELKLLEDLKTKARSENNSAEVLRLEGEITGKQTAQREFTQAKTAEYNSMVNSSKPDAVFFAQAVAKIKNVAEVKGFAMILRSDDPNLIFYNQETDITNDVITQMKTAAPAPATRR